jgi:hypothetical protein
MKLLLPIILLFSLVSPAKALMTCGWLADYYLEYAKPKGDPTRLWSKDAYFGGYVFGFTSGDDGRYFDIPLGVKAGQLAHVVGKYIQAHPEKWHLSSKRCTYDALKETWPKN